MVRESVTVEGKERIDGGKARNLECTSTYKKEIDRKGETKKNQNE